MLQEIVLRSVKDLELIVGWLFIIIDIIDNQRIKK